MILYSKTGCAVTVDTEKSEGIVIKRTNQGSELKWTIFRLCYIFSGQIRNLNERIPCQNLLLSFPEKQTNKRPPPRKQKTNKKTVLTVLRKESTILRNKLLLTFFTLSWSRWLCYGILKFFDTRSQTYIENVAFTDYFYYFFIFLFFNSYYTQEDWTMAMCCDQNYLQWNEEHSCSLRRRILLCRWENCKIFLCFSWCAYPWDVHDHSYYEAIVTEI